MTRPVLLDLFCGAGGAAMGYHMAGFDVVGVDIEPQPRYPFEFVQGDALKFAARYGHEFDVIHASPPCQVYSRTRHIVDAQAAPVRERVDMVDDTRRALEATGRPYVIENVPGAPLRSPILLCGMMFGLRVIRHRWFEVGRAFLLAPPHPRHPRRPLTNSDGGYSSFGHGAEYITVTGNNFLLSEAKEAMGIDWMLKREITQAIPPAYTRWIGLELIRVLGTKITNMEVCDDGTNGNISIQEGNRPRGGDKSSARDCTADGVHY